MAYSLYHIPLSKGRTVSSSQGHTHRRLSNMLFSNLLPLNRDLDIPSHAEDLCIEILAVWTKRKSPSHVNNDMAGRIAVSDGARFAVIEMMVVVHEIVRARSGGKADGELSSRDPRFRRDLARSVFRVSQQTDRPSR